jgi:broad-specificity NMP kinase
MVAARPSGSFKFRKNSNVGAAAAEDDLYYLERCFVDTGDIGVLEDPNNPKRIVIGRTGSGKTALLTKLKETQQNVIEISPFNLAVEYISNSQVIRFYNEAGVNLDPFFKLLWRHIFTVELIRKIHNITDEQSQSLFLKMKKSTWPDRKRRQYEFLLQHGHSFWKETDERVKEATKKTEEELKAALKHGPFLGLDLSASSKLTEEQKYEIRSLGQAIISKVKLKDLNEMFELLRAELDEDSGNPYFIVIDELDEAWADDSIRYNLIHALIETIRDFQKVRNVKIVICLRTDLIERVTKQIKGAGYQEEKIKSLFLYLTWTDAQLAALLDSRINQLVRDSFTTATVTHKDLMPNMGRRETSLDYILERTLRRPRDVITFFNFCIIRAVDRPVITKQIILDAEGEYSVDRRKSLEQEWRADYPDLHEFIDLFKKRPAQFRLSDIDVDDLTQFTLGLTKRHPSPNGPLGELAFQYYTNEIGEGAFRAALASIMYSIGFLGIKTESYTGMQFVSPETGNLTPSEINDDCLCSVHKMYWRAVGIHDRLSG